MRAVQPAEHGRGASAQISVYGLRATLSGDWPEVIQALVDDFAWFVPNGDPDASPPARAGVSVIVRRRSPDPARFGEVPQAFITSRNVVFQAGDRTIVDYGPVLAVYDRRREQFELEGEDEQLMHEAAYLFLLARIGRHLDASGLMRIHALGLSGRQGAVLVLLPSGGGKTTLALRALREPGVRLLSEDTPVLDRRGCVHPFPLRIGVNESDARLLPAGAVRRIERLEYGPKLLLSLDAFRDAVEPNPQPLAHVVIGRRWLSTSAGLIPLARRALVGPLIRDGVIGLGVAQMIEYVLRQGPSDFLGQGGVALSRGICCARALAGARAWRLELDRDPEENWNALRQLLG